MESRQSEAYRRLTSNLSLDEYKTEIANFERELEKDLRKSKHIFMRKKTQTSYQSFIPCGYYQHEKCSYKNVYEHFQSRDNSRPRHHICVFCLNLRSENFQHEAANCEMFKILDDEFQDFVKTEQNHSSFL